MTRGVTNIDIYNESEQKIATKSDFTHTANLAIYYHIIKKKKYSIDFGLGSQFIYSKFENATNSKIFDNIAFGISGYLKPINFLNKLNYGLAISNLFSKTNWSITSANSSEFIYNEQYITELPIKAVGAISYPINNFIFFYQLTAQDLSYYRPNYINIFAIQYNFKLFNISCGYGDERVYGGIGFDIKHKKFPLNISISLFNDKLQGINSSLGVNLKL